jgi:hypothetical protein
MPRKKQVPSKTNEQFKRLTALVAAYAEAAIADSWKGGGDPAEFDVLEARLALARAELNAHMEVMRREIEP